jgi:hypothetical protein
MVWGGLAYSSPDLLPSSGSKEYGRVKNDEPRFGMTRLADTFLVDNERNSGTRKQWAEGCAFRLWTRKRGVLYVGSWVR